MTRFASTSTRRAALAILAGTAMALGFLASLFSRPVKAALGEPFPLAAGQPVQVIGLRFSLESDAGKPGALGVSVEGDGNHDHLRFADPPVVLQAVDPTVPRKPLPSGTPTALYQLRLVALGPPATLELSPFVGIWLDTPTAAVTVTHAPRPGQGHPGAVVTGRWSLDQHALDELGRTEPFAYPSVHGRLVLSIRYPDGTSWSSTLEGLNRLAFASRTGIAPSWADRPGPFPKSPTDGRGSFSADLGPGLHLPSVPEEAVVSASFASYQSNEVRLTLAP